MCVCGGGVWGGYGVWYTGMRAFMYAHVLMCMCHCVYVCFTVCHVMQAYLSCLYKRLELLQDGVP